jgi:hypothetical protein
MSEMNYLYSCHTEAVIEAPFILRDFLKALHGTYWFCDPIVLATLFVPEKEYPMDIAGHVIRYKSLPEHSAL